MASWFDSVTWLVEIEMAGVFTDVSDYVVGMQCRRGRNDELDRYTAGRATIRLLNNDRRFDPTHPSGPYHGKLKPRQRMRIRCTYGATTFGVFAGVVDDWPQSWDNPNVGFVDLSCTDLFFRLSVAEIGTPWETYVGVLAPWAWYRLGSDLGLDNSGNGRHGVLSSTTTPDSRVDAPVARATETGGSSGATLTVPASTTSTTTTTIVITLAVDDAPVLSTSGAVQVRDITVRSGDTSGPDLRLRLPVPPIPAGTTFTINNRATFVFEVPTIGNVTNPFPIDPPVGERMQLAITRNDTAATIWVNGQLWQSVTVTGGSSTLDPNISADGFIVDEFLVFDRVLSSTEIGRLAALADCANEPGSTLTMRTDEWAALALDAIDWPSADRAISTDGTLSLPPASPGSALAVLRALEQTEQGRCFIDRDGKVVFRSRSWSLSATRTTTTQATFGDGTGELRYRDVQTNESGERLRNAWTVGESSAQDDASIAAYGRSSDSVSGLWALANEPGTLAAWLVDLYSEPSTRVVTMELEMRADTAGLAPTVLGLELGDLVTIRRRPQGIGLPIDVSATVEGITHSVTAEGRWRVQIATGKRLVPDALSASHPARTATFAIEAGLAAVRYATVGTSTVGGSDVIAP